MPAPDPRRPPAPGAPVTGEQDRGGPTDPAAPPQAVLDDAAAALAGEPEQHWVLVLARLRRAWPDLLSGLTEAYGGQGPAVARRAAALAVSGSAAALWISHRDEVATQDSGSRSRRRTGVRGIALASSDRATVLAAGGAP